MNRLFVSLLLWILFTAATRAESTSYLVFVSNERSADVTVIDGATDDVVGTFPVGKRPRGIHARPDGRRVFVTLSGSPRMAPGLDENRAPADKRADALGVIDPSARKLIDRWHVGSDPEQFAISKDGKFATLTFNQALLSQSTPGVQQPPPVQSNSVQSTFPKPAPIPSLPTPPPRVRGVIQRNPAEGVTPVPRPLDNPDN